MEKNHIFAASFLNSKLPVNRKPQTANRKKPPNMKKTCTLILLLAGLWGLTAQNTLLNSDFELWSYGKPVGWTVGLHGNITSIVNLPVEVNFGSQSNEAHGGSSAVRLASADLTIPYVEYTLNLPGILQAGESEGFSIPLTDILAIIQAIQDTTGSAGLDPDNLAAMASLLQLLSKGVPCSTVPASVTAWVKFQPQEGDELMMFAVAKKEGNPVSYNYGSFQTENPNAYQKIGIDLDTPNAECDSIMIVILSSSRLNSSSILYVDDIALEYSGVGIPEVVRFDGKIYPNPTNDQLFIQPDNENAYEWTLTDLSGRTLQTGKSTGETILDTRSYTTGMYLLQIKADNKISTHKVLIR